GPFRRSRVIEVADEQLNDFVDETPRFVSTDIRQFFARNLSWLATTPAVRLLRFGVNAVDNNLLSVGQEFDFLAGRAVGRNDVDDDFRERFFGSKRDRALRRLADAGKDVSVLLVALAHVIFDRAN